MVEQFDTETFDDYHAGGLHGDPDGFKPVLNRHFSPPTLTKTWFHQGPVGEEFGDWAEIDYTDEYWHGDPQLLGHTEQVNDFLRDYNDRAGRTEALATQPAHQARCPAYPARQHSAQRALRAGWRQSFN